MQLNPNSSIVYTPEDTFIIYQNHWLSVLTQVAGTNAAMDRQEATAKVAEAVSACQEYFAHSFRGRVHETDMECVAVALGDDVVVRLRVRLPISLGEFSTIDMARSWVRNRPRDLEEDGGMEIVVRGSARDREINDYGKTMLPVG